MSGVGSTNAMKKGSANNPFLAFSEADMKGYLNSAYTGCIVKYIGDPIVRNLSDINKTVPERAQSLVFKVNKNILKANWGCLKITTKSNGTETVQYLRTFFYNRYTGEIGWRDKLDWIPFLAICNTQHPTSVSDLGGLKILWVPTSYETDSDNYPEYWPVTLGWQGENADADGKVMLWGYSEDVSFVYLEDGKDSYISYNDMPCAITPYSADELYKVVYVDNEYRYEEFHYISEDKTTAGVEDVAPGKTFYDFAGTKQIGTGTRANPFLARSDSDMNAFNNATYLGKFVKYIGKTNNTYVKDAIYQVTNDATEYDRYMLLPTLENEGKASDLVQGKQLINSQGEVVEGTAVPGDTPLTLTQEKMMLGQSTVYSTDAKYIAYVLPDVYKKTLIGIDAPNCEFICSSAFSSYRWVPSGSLQYSYSNSAYVPFTLSLPKCKFIGTSAFASILKMSNIYLPEVEVIEDGAFMGNAGGEILNSIYIPKCKKIGAYAFAHHKKLRATIDCLELEEIGTYAFSSVGLVKLNFDPSKIKRLSEEWWRNISTSAIDFYNIYLPNCIEFAMGSGKTVRTVNLPNCTTLGRSAFAYLNCSSLSLPKCETIGSSAFAQFNNSSTILSLPNAKYVSDYAFNGCSVSSIYCPNLKYIGSSAFYRCSTVNITLPTSDLQIASGAFSGASILSTCSVYNGAYFMNSEVVLYMSSRQTYSEWRNSTVKVLPDGAFGWWGSYISTVELNAIESLPKNFGQAASIKTLIAPNLVTLNGDLRYLTSFDLPNVESISADCGYFGQYVSYINLPKLRGSISCYNFAQGTSVLSYNLGKVTQLGYEAFYNARISLYYFPAVRDYLPRGCINNGNLLKVWLPCVTKIAWGTCQSCTKLSTVLLRSFSSYNGESTFSGCTALSTFIVTAPEAFSFYSDFAYGTPIRNGGGSIYVRASLINSFKALATANRASFFSSQFTALENLPADVYNTLPMPFDIESLNYAMTRGSTFEEFCNSEFNAEDYVVYNGYVYTSDKTMRVAKNGVPVKPTDIAVDYDYIKYELIE